MASALMFPVKDDEGGLRCGGAICCGAPALKDVEAGGGVESKYLATGDESTDLVDKLTAPPTAEESGIAGIAGMEAAAQLTETSDATTEAPAQMESLSKATLEAVGSF
jgi:hypothetical protein